MVDTFKSGKCTCNCRACHGTGFYRQGRSYKSCCEKCPVHSPQDSTFKGGAMPPPNFEWQMGCTAASIVFVKEASQFIAQLQEAVDAIKEKRVSLQEFVNPMDFLNGYVDIEGLD